MATPSFSGDLYAPDVLHDPYETLHHVRDLGPVVWLEKQRVYALTRYAGVKQALADPDTFRSRDGVALNPVSRFYGRHSLLLSDGADHDRRRKEFAHRLTPRSLRAQRETIDELARSTVLDALRRGRVDGVQDIALRLPLTFVPDMVGWPTEERENLVAWAGATFDVLGPLNRQSVRALPSGLAMMTFVERLARRGDVLPGSMADEVFRAVGAGPRGRVKRRSVLIDYLAPSIDTTASAIAAALWLFSQHPDQWELVRSDPSLVPNAFHEVVRHESPVWAFGRRVHRATEIDGVALPAGSRVLLMFASANRDERVWDDPDAFDVTRDVSGKHVGFGHGVHGCAGQGLARLETEAILRALVEHVDRIETDGPPLRAANNVIQRFERLPVRLHPRLDAPTGQEVSA